MFIKLTGFKNNSTVVLLISNIIAIDMANDPDTGQSCTAVFMKGTNGYFAVKETPEQIMEMIENAKN